MFLANIRLRLCVCVCVCVCNGLPVVHNMPHIEKIGENSNPCKSAPCISILDTGEPDQDLPSGGVVWTNQSLRIRFRFLDVFSNGTLISISSFLSTSRVNQVSGQNIAWFSLCRENPLLLAPDTSRCICNASFKLFNTDRLQLTWSPSQNVVLHKGQFYWFVMRGNANSEEESFTWFDGSTKLFPSSDALVVSSYSTDGVNWTIDSKADGKTELPSTQILVRA